MTVRDCGLSLARACGMLALILAGSACNSKSPNGPTFGVSSVTLSSTNAVAGTVVQGSVTFTNPAPVGGLSVVLTSSNPSVATVSTPVNAASGATSAAITVATVGQGSTTITASLNGTT